MTIYFKDFRIVDLSFKPTIELIQKLEDLEEGKLQFGADYSIESSVVNVQELNKEDCSYTFLIRVNFQIVSETEDKERESHFKFVYICEMISETDIPSNIELKDENFINLANQITYSSVKTFIANFFMNAGYNPIYLPMIKMDKVKISI
ncbi:hypothetical protein [Acinetobacter pittii]|uniref:hypothetical protein n=1 Tax=Acinetobacter pittii TaxID=48296 RepID=UPI002DB9DA97|nr:hypothetical protein [Acinetobacter pittii]MEB7640514.1 hypothetical protein [Acinetobacter pittii]